MMVRLGPCSFLLVALATLAAASTSRGHVVLMDASGTLRRQALPESNSDNSKPIVAIITSPQINTDMDQVLTWTSQQGESYNKLQCRGATLSGTSDAERTALATCSLVAQTIVLQDITMGDVQAGFENSRHARTLTAIFRAKMKVGNTQRQTLVLAVEQENTIDEQQQTMLAAQVKALYKAAAVEQNNEQSFETLFDLKIVPSTTTNEILTETAQPTTTESNESLSSILSNAYSLVRESGVGAMALDTPHIAQAFVQVGQVYAKQTRAARAKIASWRTRTARGLVNDAFGRNAHALRQRVLQTFEQETRSFAGLPLVAAYRREMYRQLQTFIEAAIQEVFAAQVANLEKATLKRFQAQLLRTMNDPAESIMDSNAAALRKEMFTFETVMEDIEVPSLGLTKEKAAREMTNKLNDALMSFPDSPAAKVKRTNQVTKTVTKQKKPGQRGIDFGLDLVAMLRPDGFGSLQGFAGYQLGGNTITFGIHNDADDPQVIAQFGGVRPPLLRVQPKLRVDVEL